jgi:hypothetical protein
MKPPELSDEDKALLERMKKARAAGGAKRPAGAGPGTLADKWREPLGGEDGVGMFQPVPAGVPVGVVALDRDDGTVVYRDGRCALEIDISGPARLEAPPDGWDARLVAGAATIDLRLEKEPSAPASDTSIVDHPPWRYAVRRQGPAEPSLTFRWGGDRG